MITICDEAQAPLYTAEAARADAKVISAYLAQGNSADYVPLYENNAVATFHCVLCSVGPLGWPYAPCPRAWVPFLRSVPAFRVFFQHSQTLGYDLALLHWAVVADRLDTVKLLLEKGATRTKTTSLGMTAFDVARQLQRSPEMLALLDPAGASGGPSKAAGMERAA